jgi:hypothetical protein
METNKRRGIEKIENQNTKKGGNELEKISLESRAESKKE